jgi:hypothetical protein
MLSLVVGATGAQGRGWVVLEEAVSLPRLKVVLLHRCQCNVVWM